jgi:hypothetical protein
MRNWKGYERKRSWPKFKVLSQHSPGMIEEDHENFCQDSRSPGRDLNPGLAEAITRPRRSVKIDWFAPLLRNQIPWNRYNPEPTG